VNATASLSGSSAGVVNGVASFPELVVNRAAGRFRVTFFWTGDNGNSFAVSPVFIVAPHHITLRGMPSVGAQFPVGSRYLATAERLPSMTVSMHNAGGENITDVFAHDLFAVYPTLLQGRGGGEDVDHMPLPFQEDLFQEGGLAEGGLGLNQSIQEPVDAGIAVFAGDTGLLVRRQGGRFFVVRASIVGAEALSGLTTASPSFSIGPAAITVSPWAPCIDVSPARAAPAECVRAKGSIPSGAGTLDLAELPNLQLSFVDADGQATNHHYPVRAGSLDLAWLPKLQLSFVDADGQGLSHMACHWV
ncbi:hypothetical protein T484DRAFT_1845779, partial [Baffinella frigidus]